MPNQEDMLEESMPETEVEEIDQQEAIAESVVERLQNVLAPLLSKRRARDPLSAAQRALGQIGGHPELTDVSKLLVEFLERKRKPKEYGEGYGYGYPKPAKKAEGDEQGEAETGAHSVAQSETSPAPPDLAQTIAQALKPIQDSLQALAEWQKSVDERFAKSELLAAERALTPLAKSLNMDTSTLLTLQKALPADKFQSITDQMTRWRNAAFAGGLFEEIGTAASIEGAASQEVLLQKRADALASERKIDFAQALVLASAELSLGLEQAMPIREEG